MLLNFLCFLIEGLYIWDVFGGFRLVFNLYFRSLNYDIRISHIFIFMNCFASSFSVQNYIILIIVAYTLALGNTKTFNNSLLKSINYRRFLLGKNAFFCDNE